MVNRDGDRDNQLFDQSRFTVFLVCRPFAAGVKMPARFRQLLFSDLQDTRIGAKRQPPEPVQVKAKDARTGLNFNLGLRQLMRKSHRRIRRHGRAFLPGGRARGRAVRGGARRAPARDAQRPDGLRQDALRRAHGVAAEPPAHHRRLPRRPLGDRPRRTLPARRRRDRLARRPADGRRARRRDLLSRRSGRGAQGHGRHHPPA